MTTGFDTTPPAPTVEGLVDDILRPDLVQVRITVPFSEFIVYGAMLKVFVKGLTEASHTSPVLVESATSVPVAGWPAGENDSSDAEAWYTVTSPAPEQIVRSSDRTPFRVGPVVTLAITEVLDTKGIDIPDGGTTADTTVTLVGTAARNRQVQILHNGAPSAETNVDDAGAWRYIVTALPVTSHAFQIRGLYGNPPPESNMRRLTVVAGLTIDGPATVDAGQSFRCFATGGQQPYTFASSNTSVATIDNQGSGQAIRAGNATITVTDSAINTATHPLRVAAEPLTISGPAIVRVGNTFRFTASGGQPPYRFWPNNPDTATIDPDGNGRALKAGNTIIHVLDSVNTPALRSLYVSET